MDRIVKTFPLDHAFGYSKDCVSQWIAYLKRSLDVLVSTYVSLHVVELQFEQAAITESWWVNLPYFFADGIGKPWTFGFEMKDCSNAAASYN